MFDSRIEEPLALGGIQHFEVIIKRGVIIEHRREVSLALCNSSMHYFQISIEVKIALESAST